MTTEAQTYRRRMDWRETPLSQRDMANAIGIVCFGGYSPLSQEARSVVGNTQTPDWVDAVREQSWIMHDEEMRWEFLRGAFGVAGRVRSTAKSKEVLIGTSWFSVMDFLGEMLDANGIEEIDFITKRERGASATGVGIHADNDIRRFASRIFSDDPRKEKALQTFRQRPDTRLAAKGRKQEIPQEGSEELPEVDLPEKEPGISDLRPIRKEVENITREVNSASENTRNEDFIDDAVDLYMREIGRAPLLSAEREMVLAKRMDAGKMALQSIYRKDGEHDIPVWVFRQKIRDADAAKKELTEANLRLVVSVARKYQGKGLPLLDLIQEGNIGLTKAVEKFDYRRGFRFSTYAYWWINQAVMRSLSDQAREVRLPVHIIEKIDKQRDVEKLLERKLGREPTSHELATKLKIPVKELLEFQQLVQQPISLETPAGEEEDTTLINFIADKTVVDVATNVVEAALKQVVEDTLLNVEFTDQEREVLRLRFGLGEDVRPHTLEEVGAKLKRPVSRERVRQIEATALRKLRNPKNGFMEHLSDFQ